LRDEQGKINIPMAGGLEALIELALDDFPDGVTVGADDHAAFDDLAELSENLSF